LIAFDIVCRVSFPLVDTSARPPLSASEAAAELGVSTATVRRWFAAGELSAVRLGGGRLARIRVPREALETFLRPAGRGSR
jgi:excisionase family DNA binding protein